MERGHLYTSLTLPSEFEFPQWTWTYSWNENGTPKITIVDKEEEMTPTKKYLFNKKSASEKHAIKLGVLDKDGLLTEQGKDFLLNLLLQDEDINKRFYSALTSIKEEDE